MEIRDLAKKINTFRLIQIELDKTRHKNKSSVILSIPTMSILVISGMATLSTIEISIKTNTLWVALITLGIQAIAVSFFFIEPKLDHITTRLLLLSYLVFYGAVMFTHFGSSPFPLYWVFSYVLFAFVSGGGLESFIWIGAQFSILISGIIWHQLNHYPKLETSEIRIFIYGYLLVVGFSYLLDYASKLSLRRLGGQSHELEETNARYDVILNSIGEGLIATDTKGIVEFINKEALELLGVSRSDIIGQPLTAVVLAKDESGKLIPHRERLLTSVLASGEQKSITQASKKKQKLVRSDGTDFLVGMVVSPVKVVGQIRGAIMLFHDISIEDQIDRTKSEFVSLASHQLRTPLNVVSWYVEKLLSERKGPLNDKQKDYLSEVSTNNERMIRLVSDLLNVSRVELGKVKIKYEKVNVLDLISTLTKEIGPIIEQKGLHLNTNLADVSNGIFERSDESLVTVIIQNLLSNAIKYTPGNGNVNLTLQESVGTITIPNQLNDREIPSQKGLFLYVSDNGIGIPKEQHAQIFSKLFRADNVQTLDVSGTGLGLYVTQSFVEALGGSIWFESKEGKGTTFYVFLPYAGGR